VTRKYDIDGGHFTDRCQGFIIIALGESIVVTGATAADAGLTSTVVLCLGIAFVETAACRLRVTGAGNAKRLAGAAILVLLALPANGILLRHLQHQPEGTT
jgi:Bacterial low temperature requirement A protein (LtrA)